MPMDDGRHLGVSALQGSARDKQPLLEFILEGLRAAGCTILNHSPPDEAPFRISFETFGGERMGVLAYAFFANKVRTKNRPEDEHRFQVKYGSKTHELQVIHQDPFGIYTTLFLGIDPERGTFVAVDPTLHSPTRFFISIEYKDQHSEEIQRSGWHCWERERKGPATNPEESYLTEVLVGGRQDQLLRLVRFERAALGEDPGHRQLLAEQAGSQNPEFPWPTMSAFDHRSGRVPLTRQHLLAQEFELTSKEVLDLIADAPRLKMAVRGWVAETHLARLLAGVPDVTDLSRLEVDGMADISLNYRGQSYLIECKNVLRTPYSDGTPKLDFQKTRASKGDRCSRYYAAADFDIVAACLHSIHETWTFRFQLTRDMASHQGCPSKLSNIVRVDQTWTPEPEQILQRAGYF
ncbi:MAG: hypothetical protein H6740_12215 [Alphaproteobacteria bacterium]|nr:hypothetical protein [Alphaproteobacteria bacterium]